MGRYVWEWDHSDGAVRTRGDSQVLKQACLFGGFERSENTSRINCWFLS